MGPHGLVLFGCGAVTTISNAMEGLMRSMMLCLACLIVILSGGISHAQDPIKDALTDCSKELKTYCSTVTPGGGRLVSCAKAHIDKLSPVCISSITRATFWINNMANLLKYVATQCGADVKKYCPNVKLGDERVLNCLSDNRVGLNKYCGLALQDVGR